MRNLERDEFYSATIVPDPPSPVRIVHGGDARPGWRR